MHGPTARILIVRHGETAWNVDARIQGHLDIPLNDKGRWQAENLAISLAKETIDAIYSSDLSRALDTAKAMARLQGREVKVEPMLRERHFGIFQGRQFKDIEKEMPEQALRWRQRDPDFSPQGGESIRQFYTRCVETAVRLSASHPGQTIALVAHGGVLDCLYRAALKIGMRAPRSWEIKNASINRLLYSNQGFTLMGWGDTSHLDHVPVEPVDVP